MNTNCQLPYFNYVNYAIELKLILFLGRVLAEMKNEEAVTMTTIGEGNPEGMKGNPGERMANPRLKSRSQPGRREGLEGRRADPGERKEDRGARTAGPGEEKIEVNKSCI